MGYPYAIVVVGALRLPPVGVRTLKNAPVAGDVRDGMGVVVPIMMLAMTLVQVRIPNEVKHPFDFVDEILLAVQRVAVLVQVGLVTPGA
jgi:hypothetical protein